MEEVDDIVYVVEGKQITIKEDAVDIGGNPSAEGGDEGVEEGSQTVINVVNAAKLQPTSFDKKSFLTYLKTYMKEIKTQLQTTNPDRVPAFEKGAAAFAKKIVSNFKDYDFYTGESMNPDAMVVIGAWKEDGMTPTFIFWKDGLKAEKV